MYYGLVDMNHLHVCFVYVVVSGGLVLPQQGTSITAFVGLEGLATNNLQTKTTDK